MSKTFFKKYGVSQIELAKALGLNRKTIWETYKNNNHNINIYLNNYYGQMTTEEKIVFFASKWYNGYNSIIKSVRLIDNASYEELYKMLDSSRTLKYLFVAIYVSVYDLGLKLSTSKDIEDFVDKFVSLESLLDFILWSVKRVENG